MFENVCCMNQSCNNCPVCTVQLLVHFRRIYFSFYNYYYSWIYSQCDCFANKNNFEII